MKSQYTAPKLSAFGDVDALTQYIAKSPSDDSFVFNGNLVDADGSSGPLNK